MTIKGPATESELGDLHNKVARVMSRALDVTDKALEVYDLLEPEDIAERKIEEPGVNPALLSVIARFLHENKVTCAPAEGNGMSDLEQKLAAKKARRRNVGNVVHAFDTE